MVRRLMTDASVKKVGATRKLVVPITHQRKESVMCEPQTRQEKIAEAKQYYTESTFACLNTIKHKDSTKEMIADARKRLRTYQQYTRAIKYYETTGCSFKEAKAFIGISD